MKTFEFSRATLDRIIDLAREAGQAILKVYAKDDVGTVLKEDQSPLTQADKASHDLIETRLRALWPEIPVLSEESQEIPYALRKNWVMHWLVDPLDGTKEFIKKNGEFCINIALIQSRKPVLGVIHAPVLGQTYYAAKGLGAFKQTDSGEIIRAAARGYEGGALMVVASRSHAGGKLKGFLDQVKPVEIVNMGSAMKLCLIAEGKAHLYPRLGPTMEWDTAAGHAIVDEAGGMLTDLDGNPFLYNKESLKNPPFVSSGKPAYPWAKYRNLMG